jgi:hypothetical protein
VGSIPTRGVRYKEAIPVSKKEIVIESNDIGCHLVVSHYLNNGYVKVKNNGKSVRLHRLIYEQNYGEIQEGLIVRHKCDNRNCINPEHLEVGTPKDNTRDMLERGRAYTGEQDGESNGNSKLTKEQVDEIRADKNSTNVALGKKYGVTHSTISAIRLGKRWA